MLNFCPVDTRAEGETYWLFVAADIFLHFLFLSFCVSMCLHVCIFTFLHYCVFEFSNPFCIFLTQGQKLWHVGFLWHGQSFPWTHTTCQKYQRQDILAKTHKDRHTCKKREIAEIYLRNFFWIFRKILGWEREIYTAPKPSPEVAPSKMEVAPS